MEDVLRILFDSDEYLRREDVDLILKIAADKNTDPLILERLLLFDRGAEQELNSRMFVWWFTWADIAINVANNPSTSSETFIKFVNSNYRWDLAWWEVLNNPNFPEAAMPEYAKTQVLMARIALAKSGRATPEVLEILYRDEREEVVREVLRNHNCPLWILKEAAVSPKLKYRMAVATNSNIDNEIIELFLRDHGTVRLMLAQNPKVQGSALSDLYVEGNNKLKARVLQRGDFPLTLDIFSGISRNANLLDSVSVKTLPEGAESLLLRTNAGMCFLAQRKDTSPEAFEEIFRNPKAINAGALPFLAGNPSTPRHILEGLLQSDDADVLLEIVENPSVPDDAKEEVLASERYARCYEETYGVPVDYDWEAEDEDCDNEK